MKVTQAIGARNLLKSYAKQREAQQEQLRALIVEKKSELDRWEKCIMIRIQIIVITNIICTEAHFGERERWQLFSFFSHFRLYFTSPTSRLSTQHTALTKVEAEQQEFIEQFILQK